jgi:hypothetical protein
MKFVLIGIGGPGLDDDYTFYDDGRIWHFYDQSIHKPNQEEWIVESDISDSRKKRILEKCPEEFKEKIKKILNLF